MRKLLWPFSLLYGLVIYFRNLAFDKGWIRQYSADVPVIVIGNLSAGGTGKSPLVQYLAGMLSDNNRIAILSRGYGRSTRGFRLVSKSDTVRLCGDEPLQYLHTLDKVTVAVCESRVEGIRRLMAMENPPTLILLDDAYQHRYVRPGFTILLTEYSNPFFKDTLLPAGNLREPASQALRADVILVTKCPASLSETERMNWKKLLKPAGHQAVLFSYIHYRDSLFTTENNTFLVSDLKKKNVLLLAGIANPVPLIEFISQNTLASENLIFPDHHPYSVGDIIKVKSKFNEWAIRYPGSAVLITTRKDYMRLLNPELQHLLKDLPLYILDIEPDFIGEDKGRMLSLLKSWLSKENHGKGF